MTTHSYKEGDTVTVTITGKVERVRGDAVVIVAHGVEIPVLASQIHQAGLAQKIIELLEQHEQRIDGIDPVSMNYVYKAVSLKIAIKELCQEVVNKQ